MEYLDFNLCTLPHRSDKYIHFEKVIFNKKKILNNPKQVVFKIVMLGKILFYSNTESFSI